MTRKVKRKNKRRAVKPRIKKKKPLTKKQRSAAAKRGWKKRKANERKQLALIKLGHDRNLAKDPALKMLDMVAVHKLMNKLKGAAPTEKEQIWVDKAIKDFADEFMEEDDNSVIRARLYIAEQNGTFDEELARLADEFNMSKSEVYTIWVTP